jgi:hypothetical protein
MAATTSSQDITSILQQVKGLEEEKARLMRLLEEEKARFQEVQAKADRMSEGKRAEMRQALQGVIQKWLEDSVQDEKVREEFKQGMTRLVDSTAEDSGVWQVVCCASNVHARHLQQLEAMRVENESLKTRAGGDFQEEASRKRPREEAGGGNIWSEFEAQLRSDRSLGTVM